MKWFGKAVAIGCLVPLVMLCASLSRWAENVTASSPLESALFRMMDVPGGSMLGRRTAGESRQQLTTLLNRNQTSALYRLRAQEDERTLDFAAAEADWRHAAETAPDKIEGLLDLARYYDGRVQPRPQVAALLAAAKLPLSAEEELDDPAKSRSWAAYVSCEQVIKAAKLEPQLETTVYEDWLTRWPEQQQSIYVTYFEAMRQHGGGQAARGVLTRYEAKYSDNWAQKLQMEEELAGTPEAKLALYENQFAGDWPDTLLARYFALLKENGRLSQFFEEARRASQAQPLSLNPVLRTAFYYEQSQKKDRAAETLGEFVARHDRGGAPWTPAELKTLGLVLARLHAYDDEAKAWYTLYGLPQASAADRETALAAVIGLLLDAPEQQIQFESRDLSLYRNIATFDRIPGFLNGILSVALNTTAPESEYGSASGTAVSYFHRAGAAKLLERFRREFPNDKVDEDRLSAKLFAVYGLYGEDETLLRQLPPYLASHPHSASLVELSLSLGDVYARKTQDAAEFALYDQLLNDLAVKAQHVPLGKAASAAVAPQARSGDYARVLDRYISRLTQTHRLQQALVVFRREIDNNPADPGLFERLALFVEQNRFDGELEQTYRNAMQKFPGPSWTERLARFYLRRKRNADYQKLTQQVTGTFSGEDLETYLQAAPPNAKLNPQLYLQINLYAHGRFPHNLRFVRNLIGAYSTAPTLDRTAKEAMLRENWFYADDLKAQYLGLLAKSGRLQQMLASLPKAADSAAQNNTLALTFAGEGRAWLTQYELAAPAYAELANLNPGDTAANGAALAIERSLGAYALAVDFGEHNLQAAPKPPENLEALGELYAEREQFTKATAYWNRIPALGPGDSQNYLEAATVFWDYFQYNDALRLIHDGRTQLTNPTLLAYEAGAIYENQQTPERAIHEYVQGALSEPPSAAAQSRLFKLGRRKATHDFVEKDTMAAVNAGHGMAAFHLRLAVLEDQNRRDDIGALLTMELQSQLPVEQVADIRSTASRLGFTQTEQEALEHTVALRTDPLDKLSARLELASFFENHGKASAAEQELAGLLKENATTLGIIHANTEFYVRQKQPAKAAAVLELAARVAQPPYRKDLYREAAERRVEASDYTAARQDLDILLVADAYDTNLLAEKAATFAKQGDDGALAQFYASELASLQAAPLSGQEKQERVAGLRRGYILALIRLNKYPEALDQYIEVINRYPEDDALVKQAAQFATLHQMADRLTKYYQKASSDSPKDFRWPMVLARLDTQTRQYAEAVAAYEKASYVRPDRTDFLVAKADLETRLLRFEDALKTNARLYDLTYKNTAYLEAQATLLARLGRNDEAVKMLRAAMIDGRPVNPANYVNAAERLMSWNLHREAEQLFEEGFGQTADDPDLVPGYDQYLRLLTMERKQNAAIQHVSESVTRAKQHKREFASGGWMGEIGTTIDRYFTAEEKAAEARDLSKPGGAASNVNLRQLLNSAQLGEAYAQYLYVHALQKPALWTSLNEYQTSRLRFQELGQQLEKIGQSMKGEAADPIFTAARMAFHSAGSTADEVRLSLRYPKAAAAASLYADMIANDPAHYPSRIPGNDFGNAVVEWIVGHGNEQNANAAIRARAANQTPPLWSNAYLALSGTYHSVFGPRTYQEFDRLVGPRTVGAERSETPDQRNGHLSGDTWYYYAARYGDSLAYGKEQKAEALLPAAVELNPAASSRYVELGDTLHDTGQSTKAREQYEYAEQLSPGRADVLDRLAILDEESGDRAAAIANWRHAFDVLRTKIDAGPLPPNFWDTARLLLIHANRHDAVASIRPNADGMLHLYIKRNSAYHSAEFVDGILTEAKDRRAAIAWIATLSHDENGRELLDELMRSRQLTASERDAASTAIIERAEQQVAKTAGEAQREARSELTRRRLEYEADLEADGRYAAAQEILDRVPAEERPKNTQVRLAALNGQLGAVLSSWRTTPDARPDDGTLISIASDLNELGKKAAADQLLENVYTAQIERGEATSMTDFGLAKIRLEQKQTAEALSLVRDAVLGQDAPFQNLERAGALLEDGGLKKEAQGYYQQWQTAEPWNGAARLAAAREESNTANLDATRKDPLSPYEVRIAAARAMRGLDAPITGMEELAVLTHRLISPAEVTNPFFVQARLDAAQQAKSSAAKARLYGAAIAADPRLSAERSLLAAAAAQAREDRLAVSAFVPAVATPGDAEPDPAQHTRPYKTQEGLRTAELIAEAHTRLGEDTQAQSLLEDILKSRPPQEVHSRVSRLLEEVNRRQHLEASNGTRSPEVNNGLEQRQIVKPKLTKIPADDFIPVEGAIE